MIFPASCMCLVQPGWMSKQLLQPLLLFVTDHPSLSTVTKHRQKQAPEKMAARLQMEDKAEQDRTIDECRK